MNYEPLLPSRNEIRLLTLLPDIDSTAEVQCTLRKVSFNDNPYYKALSYCWGDEFDKHDIIVNGVKFSVTRNLWMALAQLRHHTQTTDFWVDALCIHQENVEERNLQVFRMPAIYRQAEQVVAWLGSAPEQGVNPLEEILELAEGQHIESLPTAINYQESPEFRDPGNTGTNDGYALSNLSIRSNASVESLAIPKEFGWLSRFDVIFSQPYWTRIWMVQELAVASKIQVAYGSKSVEWETLSEVVESAAQRFSEVNEVTLTQNHHHRHIAGYSGFRTFRCFRSLAKERQPLPLVEAVYKTSTFMSKDFHDKIYALLGITYDASKFVLSPNYIVPRDEFLPRMIKSYIRNSGNLDLICIRGRNRAVGCSLPTWCPDLLNSFDSTAQFESDYVFKRVTGQQFKAASSYSHQFCRDDDEFILSAQGMFLDTIEGLGTEYGRNVEYTTDENDQQLQQPTCVCEKPRQATIYELAMAVEYGSQFEIRSYENSNCAKSGWFLQISYTLAELSGIYFDAPFKALRTLSLFQKQTERPHWLSWGFIQVPWGHFIEASEGYSGYRTFDTPELSGWLNENENFMIHHSPFRRWANFRYTWLYEILLFYALTAVFLVLFLFIERNYFRMEAAKTLVFVGLGPGLMGTALVMYFINNRRSVGRARQFARLRGIAAGLGASHMRLAITRGGRVGLGHAQSRVGDTIFILKGCTVPLILRKFGDGFKVVGLCYFAGEMFGEHLHPERWETIRLH